MCGICGYVGFHEPELLDAMCQVMAHRGPDDTGTWSSQNGPVGLGHRRLSIIDLTAAGHQPLTNEDGSIWISFNGEIYNYKELYDELIARGHRFQSRTDTEVLVHLYEEEGDAFLERLNGMFALAIWDANKRRLLLARDHAGIKPLYFWQDGNALVFASEIKALLEHPAIPNRLNRAAVSDYLTLLWVPGRDTMLEGIHKLEPGRLLVWQDGKTTERRWFDLSYEPDPGPSIEDWVTQLHDTFMESTRRQMVSDVPLGAFLSGGVDSSSIAACMRASFPDRAIKCYTVQFAPGAMARDQFVDDYPYAQKVAGALDIELESVVLEPRVIDLLPKMIWHLDEPDADPAIFPSYLIAKLARDDGTPVLLSGTGGDEVLFGYRSFVAYRHYERWGSLPRALTAPLLSIAGALASTAFGAQSALTRRLRKLRDGLTLDGVARHVALSSWSSSDVRQSLYAPSLATELNGRTGIPSCLLQYDSDFTGRGALNRRAHLLIQTFLAAHNFLYTDKTSMASSVEVRVPFLDVELMRLCARIPEDVKLRGTETKYPLKKAMEPYLPHDVLYRSKTGFGAPLRKWIAEDLGEVVDDLLGEKRLAERGLFNPAMVRKAIVDNASNRVDQAYLIYALLTLELWQQTFVDRRGRAITL